MDMEHYMNYTTRGFISAILEIILNMERLKVYKINKYIYYYIDCFHIDNDNFISIFFIWGLFV